MIDIETWQDSAHSVNILITQIFIFTAFEYFVCLNLLQTHIIGQKTQIFKALFWPQP